MHVITLARPGVQGSSFGRVGFGTGRVKTGRVGGSRRVGSGQDGTGRVGSGRDGSGGRDGMVNVGLAGLASSYKDTGSI
jgi:hypothetical protein